MHGFIKISAKLKEGMLEISVTDSGIGIPADKILTLFQIFGKIENAELNPQGRGLGLNISNMLAIALGGPHMRIKSEEGIGTKVKFEIQPFEIARAESNPNIDITYSKSINESAFTCIVPYFPAKFFNRTERHAVLIVDDNDFNRTILCNFIRETGLYFDEACNGAEAVRMVEEHNKAENGYKIVVMDCDMPVMNGWKASHKIHNLFVQGKIKTLPYIIGCTAYSNEDVSSKCSKAGMICQVEKPIGKKIFTNLLKEYMI
jgi:CheY-like chemotaxis protein